MDLTIGQHEKLMSMWRQQGDESLYFHAIEGKSDEILGRYLTEKGLVEADNGFMLLTEAGRQYCEGQP